jgi:DNA invertase Pin-like site-specific DNA recombinase
MIAKAPRVFSYTRFSSLAQADGASTERQVDAAQRWAKRAGMQLDEQLTDEGLSAFHQKHITQGVFGKFLAAVKAGAVPKGSVLIVENFDRLSRADPISANRQLFDLIEAGLRVIVGEREFSAETLKKNPYDLMGAMSESIRSNGESSLKSERVRDAIRRQCEAWIAGTYRGLVAFGAQPSWLRVENGKQVKIVERVLAIRRAVELYSEGQSASMILRALHAEKLSPFPKGMQNSGHLARLFAQRQLVGEKTVEVRNDDGTTQSFTLAGYFPAVMAEAEFETVQRAIRSRSRQFVRGDIPSLLTGFGVAFCLLLVAYARTDCSQQA